MCAWARACVCSAADSPRSRPGCRSAASAASSRIWPGGSTAAIACRPNLYRMPMKSPEIAPTKIDQRAARDTAETLTITDNRTGKQYEISIKECAIRATDLRQIKAGPEEHPPVIHEPAVLVTRAAR